MSETPAMENRYELKLFRSVFLTVVVFGIYNALLSGKFIVPLPAFEIATLGICLFLAYKGRQTSALIRVTFILTGLFYFLSRSYNFSFFLSDETLQRFSETLWIDVFYILSSIFIGLLFLLQGIQAKWKSALVYILSGVLVLSFLQPYTWLTPLPLVLICMIHLKRGTLFVDTFSIWAYFLLFTLSRELTLNLL